MTFLVWNQACMTLRKFFWIYIYNKLGSDNHMALRCSWLPVTKNRGNLHLTSNQECFQWMTIFTFTWRKLGQMQWGCSNTALCSLYFIFFFSFFFCKDKGKYWLDQVLQCKIILRGGGGVLLITLLDSLLYSNNIFAISGLHELIKTHLHVVKVYTISKVACK